MKKWRRKWKIELIEETNPAWKDLFYEIGGTDEMLITLGIMLMSNPLSEL